MPAKLILGCVSLIIISLMLTGINEAKINPEKIVGIWLFDEGSSDTAEDSSKKGNNGKLMEKPKWVEGKREKALEFDQVSNYVEVPHSPSLDITGDLTISLWVKLDEIGEEFQMLLSRRSDSDYTAPYQVYIDGRAQNGFSPNTPGIRFTLGEGGSAALAQSPQLEMVKKWTHVAGVVSGKKLQVFINGKKSGDPDTFDGERQTNTEPLMIGREDSYAQNGLKGVIDEVGIFSVALTQVEVNSIMNNLYAGAFAVSPSGKLVTTWAHLKTK